MALEGLQFDHYRLIQLIGSGGMGEVYLAEDTHIPRQVAVKVVRSEPSPYPNTEAVQESERLFKREAKAIALLDHPNILPLYDYGEANAHGLILTYLVMPYRPEGSLPNWLRQRGKGALISWQDVAHITGQAAGALQHAHDHQIIHQDVKPSNFLIRERQDNEGRPDLMLADFGIAKFASATSSVSHTSRGTPTYMAPEQWAGNPQPASDQYGLAIMVYELLIGRPPFKGGSEQMMYQHFHAAPTPPSQLNPGLSHDVDEVLLRALAKNPADRFTSMLAFARALQLALLDPPSSTPTVLATPGSGNFTPPPPVPMSTPSSTPIPTSMPTPVLPPMPTQAATSLPASQPASAFLPTVAVSYSPQPGPQEPKRSFPFAVVTLLVVLVLLVGIGGGYILTNSSRSNSPSTSSSTSNNVSTTPQTQATATAPASNSTPTSQTNNGQNANPYTNSGRLVLTDPLTDNSRGYNWQTGTNSNNASCTFANGGYDVTQPKQGFFHSCTAYNTNFSNFAFEVQATVISGDYMGVIFCKEATNSYYIFIIHMNGSYSLLRNIDASLDDAVTLTSGQTSVSNTNLIGVVDNNGTISIYLNRQLLRTVSDNTYTSGQIAVLAGNDTNSAEVLFANAKVWQL
jgi:eukaryotic-like serine/threonine-protein kinase